MKPTRLLIVAFAAALLLSTAPPARAAGDPADKIATQAKGSLPRRYDVTTPNGLVKLQLSFLYSETGKKEGRAFELARNFERVTLDGMTVKEGAKPVVRVKVQRVARFSDGDEHLIDLDPVDVTGNKAVVGTFEQRIWQESEIGTGVSRGDAGNTGAVRLQLTLVHEGGGETPLGVELGEGRPEFSSEVRMKKR